MNNFCKIFILILVATFGIAGGAVDDPCPKCGGKGSIKGIKGNSKCSECKGQKTDPAYDIRVKDIPLDLWGKTPLEVRKRFDDSRMSMRGKSMTTIWRTYYNKYDVTFHFPEGKLTAIDIVKIIPEKDFGVSRVHERLNDWGNGIDGLFQARHSQRSIRGLRAERIYDGDISPYAEWDNGHSKASISVKTDQKTKITTFTVRLEAMNTQPLQLKKTP